MSVATDHRQRRAGEPAGSFASGGGGAILVDMTATLTSPTFVGRTEELARLAAAADRAAAGTPTSVLIGGEAGVGKTRLVGELVAGARAAGATVLAGGCVELGGEGVPFAPLIEALRAFVRDLDEPALARLVPGQARAELARLLPELGPPAAAAGQRAAFGGDPGPWSEQGRLFELLLGLLERLGAERRAVLVVEDLHWADRSTRDLLAFLVRNLRHGRLLLVATYRSDELHRRHPLRPFLAELDRGRRVERLELARFGPAEVAAQLAGIQGAPVPAELAGRIHARSGGNAFFVEELAATAGGAERELPPSLRDTLLARIELLAEPAQQVLEVVSVAGAAVADPLLAEVAGLPEAELLAGLREAVSAHVLLADAGDGTYGFRHALVKEAVYAELLPGERTRLHARFAAALAARDSDDPGLAAELAWHWYAAHDLERALPAAVRAGLAAERAYAFAEAQRQFERALELWERCGEPAAEAGMDKAELLARAGEAAANAGAADRAVALVRGALAEVDPAADPLLAGQLTERLAFHLRIVGRPGAFEAYQEAVRLVPPGPTVARARVLAGLGQALMLRARFAEAIATCEEAIEVARAAGDPVVEAHALNSLGTALARLGDPEGGLARLEEARRRAAELGAAKDEARACVNLSDLLEDLGRLDEAVAVASRGHRGGDGGRPGPDLRGLPGRQRRLVPLPPGPLGGVGPPEQGQPGAGGRRGPEHGHPARRPWPCWTPAGASSTAPSAMSGRPGGCPGTSSSPCSTRRCWPRPRPRWRPGRAGRRTAAAAVAEGLAALQGPLVDLRACMLLAIGPAGRGRPGRAGRGPPRPGHAADARWSATSWCGGPEAPWTGRRWPGTGPCWPPARPSRSRVQGELDPEGWLAAVAAWEQASHPYPLAMARWRAAEALLARRRSATATWPPSCSAGGTPPPSSSAPRPSGPSWSGWPGWAGSSWPPAPRPTARRRTSRRTRRPRPPPSA